MEIVNLICSLLIPSIMIIIGAMYNKKLNSKINTLLDWFLPFSMMESGILVKNYTLKNPNAKTCSLIWGISGILTLLLTIIELILNKSNLLNVSTSMIELESFIVIIATIAAKHSLKTKTYKD